MKEQVSREPLPSRVLVRKRSSSPPAQVPPTTRREAPDAKRVHKENYFPFLVLALLGLLLFWFFFTYSSFSSAESVHVTGNGDSAAAVASLSALLAKQVSELQAAISAKASQAELSALVERQKQASDAVRDALLVRIEKEKQVAADAVNDLRARIEALGSSSVSQVFFRKREVIGLV